MGYYIALIAVILLLRGLSLTIKNQRIQRKFFFITTAIVVIAFQGLRSYSVGTDLQSYIPGFSEIGRGQSFFSYQNYEAGYVLFNKLLYLIGVRERLFLIIIAAIIQIPIFHTIYRYAERPLFSVLVYLALGNFFMTFSGLRQAIAMALCFAAYRYMRERRPLPFVLLVLLATLSHTSAIICLILYPAYYTKIGRQKLPFALLLVAVIFACRKPLFAVFSMLYYGTAASITDTGAYTMLLLYLFFYLLSYLNKTPDSDFMGLRNILLLLILVNCFASVHDYIARVGFPLTLYLSLFLPRLVRTFRPRPKWVYYPVLYAACIAIFLLFAGSMNTLPFSFLEEVIPQR